MKPTRQQNASRPGPVTGWLDWLDRNSAPIIVVIVIVCAVFGVAIFTSQ